MAYGSEPTRRGLLALGVAAAATWPAFAAPTSTDGDAADRLYRRAVVLDGNLFVTPFFDTKALDPKTAALLRDSGLTAVKWTLGDTGADFAATEKAIGELRRALALHAANGLQVRQVADIAEAKRTGRIGVIFSFESASMHEGRLDSIDHFAGEGVRVMGLSYNTGSPFGGGTLQPPDKGLTPLGREAVARMDALGVTVDISHSNEATGLQAAAAAKGPVLITHAGAAAVHPHPRNKSDGLLRAVAERGGVVGIFDLSYLGDYPNYPTLDLYMRHLTHALDVCGEDHVGIGSDSDVLPTDTSAAAMAAAEENEAKRRAAGVATSEELPISMVIGLDGPDRWRVICRELLRRGYSQRATEKVLGANFQRVFAETWMARP